MFKGSLNRLLKIQYPIIQGAMAGISTAPFVAAVSEAGGLGVLATGFETPLWVGNQIDEIRQLTNKPFGVNLVLLNEQSIEIAQMLKDKCVPVILTGAGNPKPYMAAWKEAGCKVIPVVPNVLLGKKMEALGADAVVAEGMEAGGHIGSMTTFALLPQMVDALSIPVIGAGGIGDSRGLCACSFFGAKGVQLGTAFLATEECPVHMNYKRKILEARDTDTLVTGISTGHPVRGLKNPFARAFQKLEKAGASSIELEALGKGALNKAIHGNVNEGALMAGQISGLIKRVESVKSFIPELYEEAYGIMEKGVKAP